MSDFVSDSSESTAHTADTAHMKGSMSSLPNEAIILIASYLIDDKDFHSLMRTCSGLFFCLGDSNSSVWRSRFLAKWDKPHAQTSQEYFVATRLRTMVFKWNVDFKQGGGEAGMGFLEALKDVLIEMYEGCNGSESRNLAYVNSARWLNKFLDENALFGKKLCDPEWWVGKPNMQFDAIQLSLTFLAFDLHRPLRTASRNNYDIKLIYLFKQTFHPLYDWANAGSLTLGDSAKGKTGKSKADQVEIRPSGTLRLYELLHIRNYWLYHFTSPYEHTYSEVYKGAFGLGHKLPEPVRSLSWFKIPSEWIGTPATNTPFPQTAEELEEHQNSAQEIRAELSHLQLESSTAHPEWYPHLFNSCEALALDDRVADWTYYLKGTGNWVSDRDHAISIRAFAQAIPPEKHAGVPGFARIAGAMYIPRAPQGVVAGGGGGGPFHAAAAAAAAPAQVQVENAVSFTGDFYSIWAFEGAVLPGNQVMMGRWWTPGEDGYPASMEEVGPFIFWAVKVYWK